MNSLFVTVETAIGFNKVREYVPLILGRFFSQKPLLAALSSSDVILGGGRRVGGVSTVPNPKFGEDTGFYLVLLQ